MGDVSQLQKVRPGACPSRPRWLSMMSRTSVLSSGVTGQTDYEHAEDVADAA